jgi:hypothetical protein
VWRPCFARYVHRNTDRIVPAEGRSRCVGAEIGDHDLGTFAPIDAGDLFAEAARGAGDDRNFA